MNRAPRPATLPETSASVSDQAAARSRRRALAELLTTASAVQVNRAVVRIAPPLPLGAPSRSVTPSMVNAAVAVKMRLALLPADGDKFFPDRRWSGFGDGTAGGQGDNVRGGQGEADGPPGRHRPQPGGLPAAVGIVHHGFAAAATD